MGVMPSASALRLSCCLALPLAFACKDDAELPLPSCPVATTLVDGRCLVQCASADACLLTETCEDGVCTPQTYDLPTVILLEAWPLVVDSPGEADVRYLVQGADSVELLRAEPGMQEQVIASDNDAPEVGREHISRITNTTTIRLLARQGERTVSQEVTIRVRGLTEEVEILFFAADKDTVPAGSEVRLSWETENATEVALEKNGEPYRASLAPSGSLAVTVDAPTSFELVALGEGGPKRKTVGIQIEDVPPNVVVHEVGFVPESARIREGDNAALWWRAEGADQLVVFDSASQPIFGTVQPGLLEQGAWLLAPPPGRQTYAVRASVQGGGMSTKSAAIVVEPRPDPAQLGAVTVTPRILPPGEQDVPVTVSWQVSPPNAQVTVSNMDGSSRTYTGSGSHSTRVPANESVRFEVRAVVPDGGGDVRQVVAFSQEEENEINDTRGGADEIDTLARAGVLGRVNVNLDIDWFHFQGVQDGILEARIEQGMCPPGVRLELYDEVSTTPMFGAQSNANGDCPRLEVPELDARDYFLKLSRQGATGMVENLPYLLSAVVFPPDCGNGVREAGEACDDGNRADGDVCAYDCQISATHVYQVNQSGGGTTEPAQNAELAVFTPYEVSGDVEDEGVAVFALPFPFPYFGRQMHAVAVATNGYVTFLPRGEQSFSPIDPRGPSFPNAVIAPFAANLSVSGAYVAAWSEESSDRQQPRFVVHLEDLKWVRDPGQRMTAQIFLYEDGLIAIAYGGLGVPQGTSFAGFIEGPQGLAVFDVPGCGDNGCDASRLENRKIVFQNLTVRPGG